MHRPLLLEGEPGTGKTALAEALAAGARRPADPAAVLRGHRRRAGALRLGLPAADAAPARARGRRRRARIDADAAEDVLYDERFLLARPVLRALRARARACCWSTRSTGPTTSSRRSCSRCCRPTPVTIPELGTITAATAAARGADVSNRTREVHDALKRRCLYHWVEHPALEREVAIVRTARARGAAPARRARSPRCRPAAARRADLLKPPGVAETLDWARALRRRSARRSSTSRPPPRTLGAVLKYREDADRVRAGPRPVLAG